MPTPSAARLHAIFASLTVALFVVAIWLPLLGFFLGWPPPWLNENRVRQPLPDLEATRASIVSYPGRFAAAFGDRFGFRDHLIRWNNAVTLLWLHDSMTMQGGASGVDFWQAEGGQPRRIVNGGGEWFFHFTPIMMADQRGLPPADASAVDAWARELERRRAWLAERGIAYRFVIAPEKQSIYPEHLPAGVPVRGTGTDAVVERLRQTTSVEVVDLRQPLRDAKTQGRTYHRTDTHWNALGAFVAYRAIATSLVPVLPALAPLTPSDVEVTERRMLAGRFLETLGIADLALEDAVLVTPKRPAHAREIKGGGDVLPLVAGRRLGKFRTGRPGLPTAVVVHDSFMEANLHRFLSEHFARVTYVRHFPAQIIAREQPDVVIEEAAERHLLERPTTAQLPKTGLTRTRPDGGARPRQKTPRRPHGR